MGVAIYIDENYWMATLRSPRRIIDVFLGDSIGLYSCCARNRGFYAKISRFLE